MSSLLLLVPAVVAIVVLELVLRRSWPLQRALGDAVRELERDTQRRREIHAYRQAQARHRDRVRQAQRR